MLWKANSLVFHAELAAKILLMFLSQLEGSLLGIGASVGVAALPLDETPPSWLMFLFSELNHPQPSTSVLPRPLSLSLRAKLGRVVNHEGLPQEWAALLRHSLQLLQEAHVTPCRNPRKVLSPASAFKSKPLAADPVPLSPGVSILVCLVCAQHPLDAAATLMVCSHVCMYVCVCVCVCVFICMSVRMWERKCVCLLPFQLCLHTIRAVSSHYASISAHLLWLALSNTWFNDVCVSESCCALFVT